MQIPAFETVAGIPLPPKTVVEGETLYVIHNTQMAEARAYAAKLEVEGYVRYAAREIPANTESADLCNLFYTYVREDAHVFVFFAASLHMVYISVKAPGALPAPQLPAYEKKAQVSLTQISITSGMCYALQLEDGSFIMMDGGMYFADAEDEKKILSFLEEKAPAGEMPRIALWMFSHSHVDHVQLATVFLEKYYDKVQLDAVAFQFPDPNVISFLFEDTKIEKGYIEGLCAAVQKHFPSALFQTLHTGQLYRFPGAEMEILWTADMLFPHTYLTANCASAAWRMKFADGRTALIMGDCMFDSCRRIAQVYGEYLKSDIFQVAHHGLLGGDIRLYKLVDPEICLWPTPKKRFEGTLEGQQYQWCVGDGDLEFNTWIRDDSIRQRTHYSHGENVTLFFGM